MDTWKDDGGTANRPHPDWWDARKLSEVGGRLVLSYYKGASPAKEMVDDPKRLVELAGEFDVSDEQLKEALAVIDGGVA